MSQHHKQFVSTHHHRAETETMEHSENHECRNDKPVGCDDIRLCAYQKWEEAGKPSGDGIEFWLEAEQELVHAK
jgi:hypothetical protein